MSLAIDLTGRAVLVTGAAGGLGKAVAHGVGVAGATVVLSDLPGPALTTAVVELVADGIRAYEAAADLSDVEQAQSLPAKSVTIAGSLDGLVNCAGVIQTRPLAELSATDWTGVIDINLNGVFYVTQAAANHMSAMSRSSSIVTLASVAARSGRPDSAHYAASKSALLSLTKSAAMAYAPDVRVNAICPGIFLTPMWEKILAERDAEFGPGAGQTHLNALLGSVALKRIGMAGELSSVAAFLLSDLSSYITGQAINVDGGLEMD